MTSKPFSEATPLEVANALAKAMLILRRTQAELMGFTLEETVRVVEIDK